MDTGLPKQLSKITLKHDIICFHTDHAIAQNHIIDWDKARIVDQESHRLRRHSLQEVLFSGAPMETQVTIRWQQVSLILPSHNSYTRSTTTWYGSANHSSYARKVLKFA